jgi:hypothetical protein
VLSQNKKDGGTVEHQNGLLAAGYDSVRLELQSIEEDVRRLQVRADKLRAAIVTLEELIPVRRPEPTSGSGDAVWLKHDT